MYRCASTYTPESKMKDEKFFEGGQDLAGRAVYREKPFAVNGLIFTDGPTPGVQHGSPVCICSRKKSQRAAETARPFQQTEAAEFPGTHGTPPVRHRDHFFAQPRWPLKSTINASVQRFFLEWKKVSSN